MSTAVPRMQNCLCLLVFFIPTILSVSTEPGVGGQGPLYKHLPCSPCVGNAVKQYSHHRNYEPYCAVEASGFIFQSGKFPADRKCTMSFPRSPLLIFSVPASFLPVIFHLHTSLKCVITRQLPGVNANMQPFLFLQRHTFFFFFYTANILCFFLFFSSAAV